MLVAVFAATVQPGQVDSPLRIAAGRTARIAHAAHPCEAECGSNFHTNSIEHPGKTKKRQDFATRLVALRSRSRS